MMESIYSELTNDASASINPVTCERIRLILLGETGLLPDMRHLNPGKPSHTFDRFFEKLGEVVEEVMAADDRRHQTAHMSEWIFICDLVEKTKERCPEGTIIPSKALIRLQFIPTNAYTKTALAFTSRFQVQHKIQRRQLRAEHPDNHYCSAQFLYLKHQACLLKDECSLFCVDDKAKVSYGEPGHVLSTGVRGRMTLTPVTTTLVAEDRDVYHKGSFTPSVYFKCFIPSSPKESFCRGTVKVVLNDTIYQTSNLFWHAASMCRIYKQSINQTTVLLKFSDGGTDQRNTLESVKCSMVAIFLKLNLDLLVAARCSLGQSWINPVERIMSILNLGLQNCALQRSKFLTRTWPVLWTSANQWMNYVKLE